MTSFSSPFPLIALLGLVLFACILDAWGASADPALITEPDGTSLVTVTIPARANDVTCTILDHLGSATFSDDYTVNPTTFIIAAGQTTSPSLTVSVVDDSIYEGEETIVFRIRGQDTGGGWSFSSGAVITLQDNDPPPLTLTASSASVSEPDGSTTLTVSVPVGTEPLIGLAVTLAHSGAASGVADYTVGTLSLAAGQRNGSAALSVVDDITYEGDEMITLVASATGYADSEALSITLQDDDPAPLTLTASAASVSEPDGSTTLTVSVPAGQEPAHDLSIDLAHSGSATVDTDYTVGALTIAAGQASGSATLSVVDDRADEPHETIRLTASAEGYQPSAEISVALRDDDEEKKPPRPKLRLTISRTIISEPDDTVTITVSVPARPERKLTVSLRHSGSARHRSDYTVGALTIEAGERSGSTTLTVLNDNAVERDETIRIRAGASGYQDSEVLTITLRDDDDEGPPLALAADIPTGGEGGIVAEDTAPITLTVSVPAGQEPTRDLTIDLAHLGSATVGADYTVGPLIIAADHPSGSATVTLIEDDDYEGNETIILVARATGYTESAQLTVIVQDDDPAPLTLTASDTSVSEPDGSATITVSVPAGMEPAHDLTIDLTHSGSATVDTDYTVGPLIIAAGQSTGNAPLAVVDDDAEEENETIRIRASAEGYQPSAEISVALEDNEEPPDLTPLRLAFHQPNYTATEGASPVAVRVRLQPRADRRVEAPLTISHTGGATPADYRGVPAALVFESGMDSVTFQVSAIRDSANDPGESLTIHFGELPEGVDAGAVPSTTIHLTQRHSAAHFSRSLKAMLAVLAGSVAESATLAVESRIERHRQAERIKDNQGWWTPTLPLIRQNGGGRNPPVLQPSSEPPTADLTGGLVGRPPSLNLPLGNAALGGDTLSPVLWAQGDLRRFHGDFERSHTYQGALTAAHVGLDFYSRKQLLVGFSFMRSWGNIDYTDEGVTGVLESTLNTVHPYFYWQPNRTMSAWAMGGVGGGEIRVLEIERDHNFRARLQMVSGGVRGRIVERGLGELSVKGDAFSVGLRTEARDELGNVQGQVSRARVMLELVQDKPLGENGSLSLKGEIGGRVDAGDAATGAGAEAGARLGFLDLGSGLGVAFHARTLLAHQSDLQDWGVGVQASWDPGAKKRGFRLALLSARGQDGQGRTTLWDRADTPHALAARPAAPNRIETRIAYGLAGPAGAARFTPYSRIGWSGQARELRLGLGVSRPAGGLGRLPLILEMEAIRRDGNNGQNDRGLRFRLSAPF